MHNRLKTEILHLYLLDWIETHIRVKSFPPPLKKNFTLATFRNLVMSAEVGDILQFENPYLDKEKDYLFRVDDNNNETKKYVRIKLRDAGYEITAIYKPDEITMTSAEKEIYLGGPSYRMKIQIIK